MTKKTFVGRLVVEVKGGPGSGNFGHAGRPGQRGGSAGKSGAGAGFGAGAGMKAGEARSKLTSILAGTGKSGKSKALHNYYRGTEDSRVGKTRDMLVSQGVDNTSAAGFSMVVSNGISNGSFPAGVPSSAKESVSSGYDWLLSDPANVRASFEGTKQSTLDGWSDAVAAIDASA